VISSTLVARWTACSDFLETHCNPNPGWWPEATAQYTQILWTLAESIGARSVLEVGVGPHAVSGMVFAHSMAGRGGGSLWSIDIDPARPAVPYFRKARELGVDWIVFHGDSLTRAHLLPPTLQVDLLYIDGDHDFAHAYGDTMAYLPFLRPGGLLAIDDWPNDGGVREARARMEAEGMVFVHLPHEPSDGNGRLVWQKPRAS